MKIIGFSFAKTASFQILKQLDGLDFSFVFDSNSDYNNILEHKPDVVIGLGDYSRRDQNNCVLNHIVRISLEITSWSEII